MNYETCEIEQWQTEAKQIATQKEGSWLQLTGERRFSRRQLDVDFLGDFGFLFKDMFTFSLVICVWLSFFFNWQITNLEIDLKVTTGRLCTVYLGQYPESMQRTLGFMKGNFSVNFHHF